jgi:hypothetical protein
LEKRRRGEEEKTLGYHHGEAGVAAFDRQTRDATG